MDSRCKNYRQRYGITLAERDAMIASHPFCPICETPFNLDWHLAGDAPVIDHCHDTSVVRGVLCQRCNRGIGYLMHDPEILLKAISYLNRKP